MVFLQGQVDATKSAKANVDDIDSKIARIKKQVGEQEAAVASNRANADKLKGDIASLQVRALHDAVIGSVDHSLV